MEPFSIRSPAAERILGLVYKMQCGVSIQQLNNKYLLLCTEQKALSVSLMGKLFPQRI